MLLDKLKSRKFWIALFVTTLMVLLSACCKLPWSQSVGVIEWITGVYLGIQGATDFIEKLAALMGAKSSSDVTVIAGPSGTPVPDNLGKVVEDVGALHDIGKMKFPKDVLPLVVDVLGHIKF